MDSDDFGVIDLTGGSDEISSEAAAWKVTSLLRSTSAPSHSPAAAPVQTAPAKIAAPPAIQSPPIQTAPPAIHSPPIKTAASQSAAQTVHPTLQDIMASLNSIAEAASRAASASSFFTSAPATPSNQAHSNPNPSPSPSPNSLFSAVPVQTSSPPQQTQPPLLKPGPSTSTTKFIPRVSVNGAPVPAKPTGPAFMLGKPSGVMQTPDPTFNANSGFGQAYQAPLSPALSQTSQTSSSLSLEGLSQSQASQLQEIVSIFPECDSARVAARILRGDSVDQITNDLAEEPESQFNPAPIPAFPPPLLPPSQTIFLADLPEVHNVVPDLKPVFDMFPGIEKDFVTLLVQNADPSGGDVVTAAINTLLELNGVYPKESDAEKRRQEQEEKKKRDLRKAESDRRKAEKWQLRMQQLEEQKKKDADLREYFYNDASRVTSATYRQEAEKVLEARFPNVSVVHIRNVFRGLNRYAPAYEQITNGNIPRLRMSRAPKYGLNFPWDAQIQVITGITDEELKRELEFLARQEKAKELIEDMEEEEEEAVAPGGCGEEEDEGEEGGEIECACCYTEVKFSKMVQCVDGHLFCRDCLKRFVQETIFGVSKTQLDCMASDCKSYFPSSQIRLALPPELLVKYEERLAEEALTKADVQNLAKCPHCPYAEIVEDTSITVLHCKAEGCKKSTCLLCKKPYHKGEKCEEVEMPAETKHRLEIEEKMTQARLRECHSCKTRFYKTEGCNKMTCRCGALICYICREKIDPKLGYKHFCQHPRDPGKQCAKCTKCWLFTNSEQDDEMATEEVRKQEQAKLEKEGGELKRPVGPPPQSPVTKKLNTGQNVVVPPPAYFNPAVNLLHPPMPIFNPAMPFQGLNPIPRRRQHGRGRR